MRHLAMLLICCTLLPARDVRVQVHRSKIVVMPLEQYVAGVLMGEASTMTSSEALKAMAVAARTFAVGHLSRHAAEGFDFCETTHCQDLRTNVEPSNAILDAVEATEGEMLWYEGKLAPTYYSRHCGGQSAAAREVWPNLHAPCLRSAPDTFCRSRGRAEWHSEIPVHVEIVRRTASGRVAEVSMNGQRLTAEQFARRAGESYGWNVLRSNNYIAIPAGNKTRFSGIGNGHGVGLCQVGAEERGKAGQKYDSILAAYYPGTRLGASASGLRWRSVSGERVDLFAVDEPSLRELAPLADRALLDAERATGLRARMRPRVRVYPTIGIYRDATGSPGWIAGTTSGNVVRLQPLGLLRSRGALKSTVFHEMLHVVIETNAAPSLPEWFREELAQYLSGGTAKRVSPLAKKYGRPALLAWISSGLPAGLPRQ
jgi:stage II sporulation protein D